MSAGKFITFEGGDGCGKTTQAKLLFNLLNEADISTLFTREPGGTEGAEDIRKLLVTGETGRWDKMTETLLYFAARRDHVLNLIKPSIERGEWIVCDRFTLSTFAYQGYGAGLSINYIEGLHKFSIGDFTPDFTIVYDIETEFALDRVKHRTDNENVNHAKPEDRYEKMSDPFHKNVRRGFLEMAKKLNDELENRCAVINSNNSIKEIHDVTVKKINDVFKLSLIPYTKEKIDFLCNS